MDEGDGESGQRAELRAQHHRADDGDRRVGDDTDRGEQAGDDRNITNVKVSVDSSRVRPISSSQMTASAGSPKAWSSAR